MQIEPYLSEDLLKSLAADSIIVGKPPASTTEITQPCDSGPCFKAAKAHLKGIKNKDVIDSTYMINRLKQMITDHCTQFDSDSFPLHYSNAMVYGLLRVQKALQIGIRKDFIQRSFKVTGIFPFNWKRILGNCKSPISADCEEPFFSPMNALFNVKLLESANSMRPCNDQMQKRKLKFNKWKMLMVKTLLLITFSCVNQL